MSGDEVLPELAGYGPVMTPSEVADVLMLNRHHLVVLIRQGRFPGFRVGGAWKIRRADLQAVMTGRWQPPPGSYDDEDDEDEGLGGSPPTG